MKKILYSNGDSFVAGMECLGDRDRTESNKKFAFPQHLADALGCDTYINNSYNGATNNFIFNHTIFDLIELERQGYNPTDVFVVVGFTAQNRTEIDGDGWFSQMPGFDLSLEKESPSFPVEFVDHRIIFTNPHSGLMAYNELLRKKFSLEDDVVPFCAQYLWTEEVQNPSQEARIIALHEFLNSKGYDHIFVNTCEELRNTQFVDATCKNFYYLTYTSMYEFGINEYPAELRACHHFSPVVHEKYAEKLIDYIKTQNLITNQDRSTI